MATGARFLTRLARKAALGTRNALELMRVGRLGEPYGAPYEVIDEGPHHRLRRYQTCDRADGPVALLVPPLMITSEVYDLEAASSAVAALGRAGIAPYVVDFGAPEREQGGMHRTLDDHVLAVVRSIRHLHRETGREVHLCGYSQGGMFAYQAAAFLRGEGVRSLVTFGSPVDIHKNLPAVHRDATAALIRFVEPIVTKSIERIEGLPGELTSAGFKLISTRKEIEQRVEFLRSLHDRKALARREARRRFLGGEGFVAWPGPAFREFVDQFIVHNRMLSGGFVLSGRTVTLADIRCPILAFVGGHDEMARPGAVRAITRAAPDAPISFVTVAAGHFGLVVGSRAMHDTWPTVAEWIAHQEGQGPVPRAIALGKPAPRPGLEDEPEGAGFDVDVDVRLFVDAIADTAKAAWERVGDIAASASDAYDGVRYQEPRLRRLATLRPDQRLSAARTLAERAALEPDATFFLWRGRAFTYRDANTRVSNVVRGLYASGVRPGQRVGVLMGSRPSFLSMVTALSRLGAVAVLAPPDAPAAAIKQAFEREQVAWVATDPDHSVAARAAFEGAVLVLGAGARPGPGFVDMESIDPAHVTLPDDLPLDAGRARDLAIVLLRPSAAEGAEAEPLRAAKVTNHRWALSALGAAAACVLTPTDTVFCCVPLHHPTGVLASVGSALVSGSRLALADSFDVARFVPEIRRSGASVAFYAGEMLRPLVHTTPGRGDRTLPLRLFVGSGMRAELATKLHERYGVDVVELYAATTQRLIMASTAGEKRGSLGRRLPGSAPIEIVKVDRETGALLRDTDGHLVRVGDEEPGLLVARMDASSEADGGTVSGAFEVDDRWYATRDVVRRDADGDVWFVDALAGFVRTAEGPVSTRAVEDVLYRLPEIELCAAWGVGAPGALGSIAAAYVAARDVPADRLAEALAKLPAHARPTELRRVERIALSEGYRPKKPVFRA